MHVSLGSLAASANDNMQETNETSGNNVNFGRPGQVLQRESEAIISQRHLEPF